MTWYKHMIRCGYKKTVEAMRSTRLYTEESWEMNPEKKNEFVRRMALIAAESGTEASVTAKHVMCALLEAGYDVDLIAFGYAIGCIQMERDGFDITEKEVGGYIAEVIRV